MKDKVCVPSFEEYFAFLEGSLSEDPLLFLAENGITKPRLPLPATNSLFLLTLAGSRYSENLAQIGFQIDRRNSIGKSTNFFRCKEDNPSLGGEFIEYLPVAGMELQQGSVVEPLSAIFLRSLDGEVYHEGRISRGGERQTLTFPQRSFLLCRRSFGNEDLDEAREFRKSYLKGDFGSLGEKDYLLEDESNLATSANKRAYILTTAKIMKEIATLPGSALYYQERAWPCVGAAHNVNFV